MSTPLPDTQPAAVTASALLLDPGDLRELALILTEERYRLDKGDDRPVPQPRWGANVRISRAVNAALDAVARQADRHPYTPEED